MPSNAKLLCGPALASNNGPHTAHDYAWKLHAARQCMLTFSRSIATHGSRRHEAALPWPVVKASTAATCHAGKNQMSTIETKKRDDPGLFCKAGPRVMRVDGGSAAALAKSWRLVARLVDSRIAHSPNAVDAWRPSLIGRRNFYRKRRFEPSTATALPTDGGCEISTVRRDPSSMRTPTLYTVTCFMLPSIALPA